MNGNRLRKRDAAARWRGSSVDCRGNKKPRWWSGAAAGGNDSSDKYQSAKKGKQNATASVEKKTDERLCAGGRLEYFQDVSI